jgi:hypothetical protein
MDYINGLIIRAIREIRGFNPTSPTGMTKRIFSRGLDAQVIGEVRVIFQKGV